MPPQRKVSIDSLMILGSKTVIGYMVFIVFFFAVPIYKEIKSLSKIINNTVYAERVVIGESSVKIKIVDTVDSRQRGLSGTVSLPADEGLLFVFDAPDFHGIWMKDMNFSIDIIWLDETKRVVSIAEQISPDTYPQSFVPNQKALYVLEVNAGFVKKAGIKIGDQATIL